jgi:hypothetical protein
VRAAAAAAVGARKTRTAFQAVGVPAGDGVQAPKRQRQTGWGTAFAERLRAGALSRQATTGGTRTRPHGWLGALAQGGHRRGRLRVPAAPERLRVREPKRGSLPEEGQTG